MHICAYNCMGGVGGIKAREEGGIWGRGRPVTTRRRPRRWYAGIPAASGAEALPRVQAPPGGCTEASVAYPPALPMGWGMSKESTFWHLSNLLHTARNEFNFILWVCTQYLCASTGKHHCSTYLEGTNTILCGICTRAGLR